MKLEQITKMQVQFIARHFQKKRLYSFPGIRRLK
jgi:hypothetical protein